MDEIPRESARFDEIKREREREKVNDYPITY